MAETDALVIRLEADLTQLKREMKSAQAVSQKAGRGISRAFSKVGASLKSMRSKVLNVRTAMVGIGAVTGFVALGKKALNAADDLEDFSKLTGVTIEKLQELRFAAEFVGTGAQTLDKSLIRLQKSMGEIATGQTSEAADAFKLLGLSQQDIIGLSGDTGNALQTILGKVQGLGGEMEKTVVLADIFGLRLGPKLKLLAEKGAEGLKVLTDRARASGAVMDSALVKAASDLKDEFTALEKAVGTTFQARLLESFVGELGDIEGQTATIAKGFGMIGTAVGGVLSLIAKFGQGLGTIGQIFDNASNAWGTFATDGKASMKEIDDEILLTQVNILKLKDSATQRFKFFVTGRQDLAELRQQMIDLKVAKDNLLAAETDDVAGGMPAPEAVAPPAAPVDTKAEEAKAKALVSLREHIDGMKAEAEALGIAEEARGAHNARIEAENKLRAAGIAATSEQGAALLAEAEAANAGIEAAEKKNEQLAGLADALERGKTEQQLFNEQVAIWNALAAEDATLTTQVAEATAQLQTELEAAKVKTTEVKTAATAATDQATELGVSMVNSFERAMESGEGFKGVLKGLLTDVVKLGLEMLKVDLKGGASGSGGGGGGFGGLFKGLIGAGVSAFAGGGGGGAGLGGGSSFSFGSGPAAFKRGGRVGTRAGNAPVSPVFNGAPGFALGGTVSPRLARDEVPIIAHAGEKVLTEEQQRRASSGGADRPISIQMTVNTPDANSFRASQDQVVGDLSNALRHAARNQ